MKTNEGCVLAATTTIEMDFRSDPSIVSRTRQYIAGLYSEFARDEDLGDRLSMVVYELLENVAKYGASTPGKLEISLHADGAHTRVRVRTSNAASPERLARLREALDAATVQGDPTRSYDAVIARRAITDDGESGLGIARVRAEGHMQISYSVDGEVVTIDAEWSGRNRC